MKVLAWPAYDNATGNPYNRLLSEAMERAGAAVDEFTPARALSGRYDVWHVHWPDDFLSIASPVRAVAYVVAELVLMALARLRGTRLVWTVHDLGPHESPHPWLEPWFWRAFVPLVDGYVTLSAHARREAERQIPALRAVPGAVVPHGPYRSAYPDPVPKADARAALDLPGEATVLAYAGRIRPYKNVPALIDAFRGWDAPEARLLVTGNPSSDALRQTVAAAASGDARVRLDLRFVPDDAMPLVLGAADLVVLPYAGILHSGTALLALSFDRPVLLPAAGAMPELRDAVGAAWVRTYDGPLTPGVLRDAATWAQATPRPDRAPLDALDWNRLARQTLALYRRVVKAGG